MPSGFIEVPSGGEDVASLFRSRKELTAWDKDRGPKKMHMSLLCRG